MLVSFENRIDEAINKKIIALWEAFNNNKFKGFIEAVPAYNSLAVFYDLSVIRNSYLIETTVFDFVKQFTEKLIGTMQDTAIELNRLPIVIPVYYNGEDLQHIANQSRLSVEEVIGMHSSKTYHVYMIGFLPGFAYMGKVDDKIAASRHSTPRDQVTAGSVGIAGFQTGIYPLNSPGGWQIIGQTPIKIFDSQKEKPCLLNAGDAVQFAAIDHATFNALNEYKNY